MGAVLSTPADIVNDALVRIGYKNLVGELQEGSTASQLALAIYGQTRDEMLRGGDWGFAQGDVVLTLLKQAPAGGYVPGITPWSNAYPPMPWLFEYAYNSDMLQVRSIRPQAIFVPNFDPQPNVFNIANDNSTSPAKKVILTNVPNALCTYTRQVVDPTTWEPDFAEALAEALGERLAAGLVGADAAKLEAAESQMGLANAEITQG
jgi:hypothetical protein